MDGPLRGWGSVVSGHGVTEQDLGWLAYGARRLREETHGCGRWDDPGIGAAVAEMRGWNLATAVERVLRRATDPEARTPRAMLYDVAAPLPSEKAKGEGPAPRPEECPKHVGQSRPPFCGPCNTEKFATGDDGVAEGLPKVAEVNPRLAQRLADRLGGDA